MNQKFSYVFCSEAANIFDLFIKSHRIKKIVFSQKNGLRNCVHLLLAVNFLHTEVISHYMYLCMEFILCLVIDGRSSIVSTV